MSTFIPVRSQTVDERVPRRGWLVAATLDAASAPLFRSGLLFAGLLVVFLALVPFDARTVTGINPWIKPAKFASSIAIYLLTVAWLVGLLELARGRKRFVEWSLVAAFAVEIVLIAMQAARGTTSHFNNATAFDAAVFGVMGAAIVFAAAIGAYLLYELLRQRPGVPAPVLLGARLGLAIFLLANVEGFAMVAANAHTIGAPDGGPGLPFVNWSTRAGDLRIAHFLGMHAIQALPFAGYLLYRLEQGGRLRFASRWLLAIAALYAAANVAVFALAMLGRPLVGSS
jgi:ABC-type Co2+ transport system permease subunit